MVSGEVDAGRTGLRSYSLLLRFVLVLNYLRFALSFSKRFEGTADSPGLADQIFAFHVGGFRVDIVWLLVSTIFVVIGLIGIWGDSKRRLYITDAGLCLLWMVALVIYVVKSALTGLLDFG